MPSILGVEKPLRAALDDEAADDVSELGPHHRHIGDRGVGDPGLGAVELEAAGDFLRARRHGTRIGAVIGLGQAEAADQLGAGELGQIFAPLRLAAVGVDRIHHQRRLHRHRRAVAAIDALKLARDQPVGHVAQARAAVLFRRGRAEQAELAHLGQHVRIVSLVAVGRDHARHQVVLRKAARGVAHHALLFAQLAFEIERILPLEVLVLQHRGLALALLGRLRHILLSLNNLREAELLLRMP